METFFNALGGSAVVIVILLLFKIEDWILAWKGHPEPDHSECFNRYGDIDANERGYNDAAGWLLYGISVEETEASLINANSDPEYDEGVWEAIADWAKMFPDPKSLTVNMESPENYHGA